MVVFRKHLTKKKMKETSYIYIAVGTENSLRKRLEPLQKFDSIKWLHVGLSHRTYL